MASKRGKFILTRPRRFGKTLLLSTFESLFRHGLRDFRGLDIEKIWKEEKPCRVVRADFSEAKDFSDHQSFEEQFSRVIAAAFGKEGFVRNQESSCPVVMQLSAWLDFLNLNSLVLLIDNYDAPLVECLDNEKLFILSELSRFHLMIKSCDGCVRFLFLTGVAKISDASIFGGALDNLVDISLVSRFGTLLGFTGDEVSIASGTISTALAGCSASKKTTFYRSLSGASADSALTSGPKRGSPRRGPSSVSSAAPKTA